jgi:hypothetical protein
MNPRQKHQFSGNPPGAPRPGAVVYSALFFPRLSLHLLVLLLLRLLALQQRSPLLLPAFWLLLSCLQPPLLARSFVVLHRQMGLLRQLLTGAALRVLLAWLVLIVSLCIHATHQGFPFACTYRPSRKVGQQGSQGDSVASSTDSACI